MGKVLLCGRVDGNWELIFERVRKLNASAAAKKAAPFDMLLVVGGVFPFPIEYLTEVEQVPIPTYLLPTAADEEALRDLVEDEEGGPYSDVLTTIEQTKTDGEKAPVVIAPNCFCLAHPGVQTIDSLLTQVKDHGDNCLDFLLTTEYPANFDKLVSTSQVPTSVQKVDALAPFLQQVFPKYHVISASPASDDNAVFYQRLPYFSDLDGGKKQVTRLIGLCGVNDSKDKSKKYLHALQVTPSTSTSNVEVPSGTTANPYIQPHNKRGHDDASLQSTKRPKTAGLSSDQVSKLTQQSANANQFFYDTHGPSTSNSGPKDFTKVPHRTECWFCLATPKVARQLIVTIGEHAYLALAKGGINDEHLVVVPVAHAQSSLRLPEATRQEIDKFLDALKKYYASQGLGMMVLDRNVATKGTLHWHLQVVGIPGEMMQDARKTVEEEGRKSGIDFQVLPPGVGLREALGDETSFLYVEVPDAEGNSTNLLHVVHGRHDMTFARRIATIVLNRPDRLDWRRCVLSEKEEADATNKFRERWAPFDFSLEYDM